MNIVLIIFDSLRKDCLGCYKENPPWGKVLTPNFDRFAENSLIMDRVFPETLPTLPMRRAIYTGKRVYPFINGDFRLRGDFVGAFGWGPIPEDIDTISEILQENGYRTCLISSVYHQFKPSKNYWRGFDQWTFIRGKEIDPYKSGPEVSQEVIDYYLPEEMKTPEMVKLLKKILINSQNWKYEEDYPVARVFIEAAKWLEENADADKFFLLIESFDPHEPWQVPAYYRKIYDKSDAHEQILSGYEDTSKLPPEILKRTQANYSGLTTMCDKWFGYFYEKLENMGLVEDTLIILTSDHGHSIGDKNYIGKRGYPSAREVFDIPLMIKHPKGEGKGKRSNILIQHHDITALILRFAQVKLKKEIDGIDFWENALEEKPIRDYVVCAWGPAITVIDDNWWFNCLIDGKGPFLYNLKEDPFLTKNVAVENKEVCDLLYSKAIKEAGGKEKIPEFLMKAASKEETFPGCSPVAAREISE